MRIIALVIAICIALTSWCQQLSAAKPSAADLLTKLHSRHWSERSDALDEIGSDQAMLHSRKVQAALIDLLDQENHGKDTGDKDDGGEEFAEYFASLREMVDSFANWNDPRQACIMVDAGFIDYPPSPADAAARASAAIPCILKRSRSEVALDRAVAGPMLVEAMQKSQGTLDAGTAQSARQIILGNLRDPDDGVRATTVDALGKFGGPDMVPALQVVAQADPSPEVQNHSIRKLAAEAIVAIQKRADQH
jgi:hypothetical protein